MSEADTYNGWEGKGNRASAYATWNVALWLDNEPGTYGDVRELVSERADDYRAADEARRFVVVRDLAQAVRDYVEALPEIDAVLSTASMASDLLGSTLDEVSWQEIAEHYLSDVAEEAQP